MLLRSRGLVLAGALSTLILFFYWASSTPEYVGPQYGHGPYNYNQKHGWPVKSSLWRQDQDDNYYWKTVKVNYPHSAFQPLPTSAPVTFPKVQATFPEFSISTAELRRERQQAVKETFKRCWNSYKKHAWMADELSPVSAGQANPFGGWAATLVDSLDTLWIMDMREDFDEAVAAVDKIDFTKTELKEVNIFETNIRYLGGFLAAFELSADMRLLRKAVQVGEMIYKAFDTPNHMPITRWDFHAAGKGENQVAAGGVLVAEIGSLCMELTRLSQLTGDPKWFDASQSIMNLLASQQDSTKLPGQWPLIVDAKSEIFNQGSIFTLGAMADSVYEYLPKMAAMMGGQLPVYQAMYEKAVDAALQYNLYRPMTPENKDILISGQIRAKDKGGEIQFELESQGQHLVCFLGGMLALGGRLFNRQQDVDTAAKLTNGCIYTYEAFPHGIMPETFHMMPCDSKEQCQWDEKRWKEGVLLESKIKEGETAQADAIIKDQHLPGGFTRIPDRRYILRPEAIESVFMMYRITGEHEYTEHAWTMFKSIEEATKTELANTAVWDVTVAEEKPRAVDSMESFWMGETLKYFYLIFSDPELISLDEYVFNTEAHPLRRLVV
ncbi:putative class I alpha-mannosidase [Fusarium heterosporum]|uniref:alpha-1,2-Mannosidase n=1 Tax=Fusarium heterosporum TaxID=42747 RepID=A0A8H5SV85_FUSHE|nr:putative class I alpha-mannosidase [Fusarium heterosporum]